MLKVDDCEEELGGNPETASMKDVLAPEKTASSCSESRTPITKARSGRSHEGTVFVLVMVFMCP